MYKGHGQVPSGCWRIDNRAIFEYDVLYFCTDGLGQEVAQTAELSAATDYCSREDSSVSI